MLVPSFYRQFKLQVIFVMACSGWWVGGMQVTTDLLNSSEYQLSLVHSSYLQWHWKPSMLVRQVPPFLQTLFSQELISSEPGSGLFPDWGLRVVRVVRAVVRVVSVVLSGSEISVTIVLVSPVSRVVFVMSEGERGSVRNILCIYYGVALKSINWQTKYPKIRVH